jgi:hypothetical protein
MKSKRNKKKIQEGNNNLWLAGCWMDRISKKIRIMWPFLAKWKKIKSHMATKYFMSSYQLFTESFPKSVYFNT